MAGDGRVIAALIVFTQCKKMFYENKRDHSNQFLQGGEMVDTRTRHSICIVYKHVYIRIGACFSPYTPNDGRKTHLDF